MDQPDASAGDGDTGDAQAYFAQTRLSASRWTRFWAVVVAVGCGGVLAVAIKLSPDGRGYGTHQKLGFRPCGMLVATGLPCPTCGMTTAFSNTIRGRWIAALRAQVAGFALALATAVALVVSLRIAVTGRVPMFLLDDRILFRLFMALLVLLIAGWAIKLGLGFLDHSLPVRSVPV